MEEKIIFAFKYKGYSIIISDRDNVMWIYPTHETIDIDEDNDTENCQSVESCIQWIDEDVRCREEEKKKELTSYRITLKYRDKCNGMNGPITEKFIYSQTIIRQYSDVNELFKAQMEYLTKERGYSVEDIVLIDWDIIPEN